ncbi:non-homologous end-joining DNA ligase [Nocardioides marmorisolisilvae]|uniref:DNA ligase (ATP) n=1 Tax=Nocardioides marmorisolisilvae TaxID=1542737 RepID=A0A3N0DT41_9ACTN|nr:non-homologous end-joining DNA ligase [Nocardioides marmorisolisilvae]RNL78671.1 DNA ligase [Nocardioides marmorisolisilvae]
MKPMLATRGDQVPSGTGWAHEVKWDGIRALVEVAGGRVRITSRNENDVTPAYPELLGLADLGHDLLLDGEIVALGSGVPSFSALADRMHVRDARKAAQLAQTNPVTLLVFDLLALDGEDLTRQPFESRRQALENLGLNDVAWQVPPTYENGAVLLEAAEAQGLEGIVSKKLTSLYFPDRRSKDWLKFPIRPTGSYLVGGYRHETGSDQRLGAVLVGEPTEDGLVFRGRVGSGIAGKAGQKLGELLRPLAVTTSPFAEALPRLDTVGTVWVEPSIIVDVQYLTLTPDGRLRQPAYRGIRTDLTPEDLG